ncbi:hypothetical protein CPB86DRAFT_373848 [Serendipita vermifera]|nr:hypothetical protein CPB86DRAFT_373848 [Serendipita vermifera]
MINSARARYFSEYAGCYYYSILQFPRALYRLMQLSCKVAHCIDKDALRSLKLIYYTRCMVSLAILLATLLPRLSPTASRTICGCVKFACRSIYAKINTLREALLIQMA